MTTDDDLLSIRCPITKSYVSKHTGKQREKVCGRLVLKVTPGSKGEAYCWSCYKLFGFEVPSQHNSDVVMINSEVQVPS